MPIRQSHEPPTRSEGNPPDSVEYVSVLAEKWWEMYQQGGGAPRLKAFNRRFRASWSGICSRALAYRLAEVEQSDPPTMADSWRMGLGQLVHDALGPVLKEAFPHAQVEFPVDLAPDLDGSATVDIWIPDRSTLIELKTINGFSFKSITTQFKSPAEGPRHSAVVQGALAADALDAEHLVVGYLSLELIGVDLASKFTDSEVGRFAAEWHYTRDEYRPLAEAERARVKVIMSIVDDAGPEEVPRTIPDPHLPPGAKISEPFAPGQPTKGLWIVDDHEGRILDAGATWHCAYCAFRRRCDRDG